jgi:hypothetical protein
MIPASPEAILEVIPNTRFFSQPPLLTFHPTGIFDDDFADLILEFLEAEEGVAETPFDRYTDLDGLSEIHLKIAHFFANAERRRTGYHGEPVKSAIVSERVVGFGMARMYEALMDGAAIHVRAFHSRRDAALWLGVPLECLLPPD